MTAFAQALVSARAYARKAINPFNGDDPDDIAEVWNEVRDLWDLRTNSELTPRQLDLVADEVVNVWRK